MKRLFLLGICLMVFLTACSSNAPLEISESEPLTPEKILTEMTLEEKVGQMFIARCPSVDAPIYAKQYKLGGYILFGQDFKNSDPETFKSTVKSYQDAVNIPMFIAVDEEGGIVTRASRYPQFREEPFPSPQKLYTEGGFDAIKNDAKEKSEFLLDLGINLNFAPVCDVSQSPDDFMYKRSIALNSEDTATYVKTVVSEMKSAGMGSVLKHFPGYGNNADTHTGIAIDKRPYKVFAMYDFIPFKAGIEEGAGIVLVSHNIVECMDKDMPASLSPKVIRILREELEFNGLIITDDLVMDAIGLYTDNETAAVQAVIAGNDLLCCTDFTEQIPAVIEAVKSGKISEDRINESVLRILEYKMELGIIK